jgi:anti-sigma B factor antagonist
MVREHGEGRRLNGAPPLRIARRAEGSDVHVDITGEIDVTSSGALSDELLEAARTGSGPIIVNLGHVSFLDSSGLHALVVARETAGPRLQVGTVNPVVRRVLEMTSLLGHLQRSDGPTPTG